MTNHNDVHRAVQDIVTHVNETIKKSIATRWINGLLPIEKPALESLIGDIDKEVTKASQASLDVYHRVFDSFIESNVPKKNQRAR